MSNNQGHRPQPCSSATPRALHPADPDAQAAHGALPWITIFDDHEVTNNAWADGAGNHRAGEGDYVARREAALQASLEWMPFRLPDQTAPHRGTPATQAIIASPDRHLPEPELGHLAAQPASAGDAVVLTGDIHSSWGAELPVAVGPTGTYTPVGAEFVTPSVTSDGFYEMVRSFFPSLPAEAVVGATGQVAGVVQQANPWVRHLNGIGHGYTVIDVAP